MIHSVMHKNLHKYLGQPHRISQLMTNDKTKIRLGWFVNTNSTTFLTKIIKVIGKTKTGSFVNTAPDDKMYISCTQTMFDMIE